MQKTTRRVFLKSSAALAAGSTVLRDAHALGAPETATTPLSQFASQDVELLDGPMLEQFRIQRRIEIIDNTGNQSFTTQYLVARGVITLGGANDGVTKITIPQAEVFAAMKRDLIALRRQLTRADL